MKSAAGSRKVGLDRVPAIVERPEMEAAAIAQYENAPRLLQE